MNLEYGIDASLNQTQKGYTIFGLATNTSFLLYPTNFLYSSQNDFTFDFGDVGQYRLSGEICISIQLMISMYSFPLLLLIMLFNVSNELLGFSLGKPFDCSPSSPPILRIYFTLFKGEYQIVTTTYLGNSSFTIPGEFDGAKVSGFEFSYLNGTTFCNGTPTNYYWGCVQGMNLYVAKLYESAPSILVPGMCGK